jgi:hypothetical protein
MEFGMPLTGCNNTVAFAPNALVSFIPNVNQASLTKTRTVIASYVNNASSGGTSFTVLGSTPIHSPLRELIIQPFPTLTINPPR